MRLKMRVLLVEDEPSAAWVVETGLRERAFEVDVCRTGRAALARASSYEYQLAVLDVGLPDTNGLAVCRELRVRGLQMPVLMLTARDAVEERVAGLDAGADDYLVKPYDFPELLARVRALLRRPRVLEPEVIELGHLRMNRRRGEVRTRAGVVELTAKEYRLLECLARRRGEMVSRMEILDYVWSGFEEPESNVVEVYIRRLRRKLGDGQGVIIRTRRGLGYILDAPDAGA
jgi:two-component system copper resistance phosphate regulon response regulator CusR